MAPWLSGISCAWIRSSVQYHGLRRVERCAAAPNHVIRLAHGGRLAYVQEVVSALRKGINVEQRKRHSNAHIAVHTQVLVSKVCVTAYARTEVLPCNFFPYCIPIGPTHRENTCSCHLVGKACQPAAAPSVPIFQSRAHF
jgi:hypothetical protein